ncbi:MAG TPA: copper chaperone, partial [Gemmatales bacterium]|nr:copper chaperone [Gemmatales bacterium]
NLQKFADAYRTYDVVARRSRLYGLAYPFIELGLGIAYILHWQPVIVNVITLVVMGVSTIGVVQSLLARKTIQCACLGTVFNLPMSSITLVEDLLMVSMSALMLFM